MSLSLPRMLIPTKVELAFYVGMCSFPNYKHRCLLPVTRWPLPTLFERLFWMNKKSSKNGAPFAAMMLHQHRNAFFNARYHGRRMKYLTWRESWFDDDVFFAAIFCGWKCSGRIPRSVQTRLLKLFKSERDVGLQSSEVYVKYRKYDYKNWMDTWLHKRAIHGLLEKHHGFASAFLPTREISCIGCLGGWLNSF